jgi:Family of unknown function (DUF6504)
VRRYDEAVAVEAVGDASGEPSRFLWRGRLYVVRGVLAHWVELGAWWRQRDREGLPVHVDGGGREVWRVEARPGRSEADGVYDLAYDASARAWSLTHALD